MKDFLQVAPIGVVIWWLAQTLLSLRDYFERRDAVRRMPPPSEEEKLALARLKGELPRKEKKSLRWYAEHPREALKHGWIFVPVLVFFWPMAVLLFTLPPLPPRLSKDFIQRLNAERT
jgi:hypothetical protein